MATEWISRDAVFAALNMSAVLEHYQIKSGRGSSFRILCPFHDDERPSCSINPEAKLFNCFGCGEQGNVLDFIALMEVLDPRAEFRAVLEKAIEIIGNNPTEQKAKRPVSRRNAKPSVNNAAVGKSAKKKKPKSTSTSTSKPKLAMPSIETNSNELMPNRVLEVPAFPLKLERKHSYLTKRMNLIGIDQALLDEFGIGFEPRANALMAGRICFPIHNVDGDLVAYSGRWASDAVDESGRYHDAKGKEQERYRLPKGFHKQSELFNLHRVLEFETKVIVLVEGFWSVLRLHSLNIPFGNNKTATIPTVGLMGLTISVAQIKLLKKNGFTHLVVMLDGDAEGIRAMAELAVVLARDFYVRTIHLPEDKKPDDVEQEFLIDLALEIAGLGTSDTNSSRPQRSIQKTSSPKETPLKLPSLNTSLKIGWKVHPFV